MNIPELILWSFNKKPRNLFEVTEHFGEAQQDLFKLLEILKLIELLRDSNLSNIQKKLAETVNWQKFLSFGSELFFGNEFLSQDFSINFIPDYSKDWSGKKPDFSALKGGQNFLTEVARVSDDETVDEIAARIKPIIIKSPFRVEIEYSEDFSIPVIESKQRGKRQELIEKFVDEFKKTITTLDPTSIPQSCNVLGCQVTFTKPLRGKRGYYAGCVTGAVLLLEEKLKQHIKGIIKDKAEKRVKWTESQRKIPYLIALDIQQTFISIENLVSLLFGGRCYFDRLQPQYSEPSIVSIAKANGWQEFLELVGFSQQTQAPVTQPGLLITDETTFKNVTSIIVKLGGELHYLPNPFAEEPINSLDIHALVPGERLKRFSDKNDGCCW